MSFRNIVCFSNAVKTIKVGSIVSISVVSITADVTTSIVVIHVTFRFKSTGAGMSIIVVSPAGTIAITLSIPVPIAIPVTFDIVAVTMACAIAEGYIFPICRGCVVPIIGAEICGTVFITKATHLRTALCSPFVVSCPYSFHLPAVILTTFSTTRGFLLTIPSSGTFLISSTVILVTMIVSEIVVTDQVRILDCASILTRP
mmetsp:Transcript_5076/g.10303  ORF Transcript_5076/g.10303 Transcript_5076/m.10303 type:complete len:201 (-) Transcript_5076:446-1048(-)